MNQNRFDNMIQVLAYFANQCDMFKPLLDGVVELQQENVSLNDKLEQTTILQNRLQLSSTFSADYANFGVITSKVNQEDEVAGTLNGQDKEDLYSLILSVISVGPQNYDRTDMEYMLDFYSMVEKLDFERYIELWDLMDSQLVTEEPSLPEGEE